MEKRTLQRGARLGARLVRVLIRCARVLAFGCPIGLACLASPLFAQRSSLRHFDVADGLPSPRVSSILEDSRGFLWITTFRGLGRFDGTRFEMFGNEEGLQRVSPNEVREDRRGRLWVALNGEGLARLLDEPVAPGKSMFRMYSLGTQRRENTVNALYFDSANRCWLGTESGIARAGEKVDGSLEVEFMRDSVTCLKPQAACATSDDAIWFVGPQGLACVRAGELTTTALPEPSQHAEYLCIAARSASELLIGDDHTLWSFDVAAGTWKRLALELATNQGVRALFVDSEGDTWVGTTNGLIRLRAGEQLLYTTDQGLPDNSIRCAFEDRSGHLWLGTWFGGVVQFGRGDLISWSRSAEMPNPDVTAITSSSGGQVLASSTNDGLFALDERGAKRLGAELSPTFDRIWTRFVELPGIGWVLGTDEGLYLARAGKLDLGSARKLGPAEGCGDLHPIAMRAGHAPGQVLVSDLSGRLLRGKIEPDGTAHFADLIPARDRPAFDLRLADAIRTVCCASDGTVWVASRYTLARQVGAVFEFQEPTEGLPTTEVRDVLFDARGRLWVALRHDGLSLCSDPSARTPKWRQVESLSGESTFSIATDHGGRIYAGTWNGVFQLDPDGALLRHFTHAAGLLNDSVNALAVDAEERVWVATPAGVTRLETRVKARNATPPAAWISRVEVDGEAIAIPRRATQLLGPLELDAGHDTLLVGFCAPWLESEEPLRFQLQLAGVDAGWSRPQSDRQVRFARLPSGEYRLLVRAVLGSSMTPGEQATLLFSIPPALWKRPWFIGLALLLAAGTLFAWHRVQLRQALALERVRSQIALDLHDELGADLTQVAILAELARREAPSSGGDALLKVAGLARDMRESLADIVWSVDPRRDKVGDLVVRLRQVGNQLVEAGGIEFALLFDSDRAIEALPIAPDERRGLYLIVKESIHNAVKHAGASRIDVALRVHGSQLTASIQDDGRGFDPKAAHAGHGLRGLHTRAKSLGAQLSIRSEIGSGTSIELALGLRGGPA